MTNQEQSVVEMFLTDPETGEPCQISGSISLSSDGSCRFTTRNPKTGTVWLHSFKTEEMPAPNVRELMKAHESDKFTMEEANRAWMDINRDLWTSDPEEIASQSDSQGLAVKVVGFDCRRSGAITVTFEPDIDPESIRVTTGQKGTLLLESD